MLSLTVQRSLKGIKQSKTKKPLIARNYAQCTNTVIVDHLTFFPVLKS